MLCLAVAINAQEFGMIKQIQNRRNNMKKVKLAFIAAAAVLCFACGGKTEADFSVVPIKGANGEYQYIDISQKGKIVINPQFERAHIFRDGLALVKASGSEGKWGYIDKKGKFAIAPVYSKAQDFGDGVAWVQIENQPPMLIDKKRQNDFANRLPNHRLSFQQWNIWNKSLQPWAGIYNVHRQKRKSCGYRGAGGKSNSYYK